MRKKRKDSVLSIIESLDIAYKYIEKLSLSMKLNRNNEKEVEEFINLLTTCQETAIAIGNAIEEEYENHSIINKLEKYCEFIFQLSDLDRLDTKEILEQIKKSIRDIYLDVEKEEVHYEIVFLPYKASMWDSMESVWKQANKENNYDCKVIPIPYINKVDGDKFELICEAKLFPNEIPTIDYKTYNIERNRPDVIFIHNPYDENNVVTSVHPDYYSKKLKEYTDCLTYIPYFIVSDDIYSHFCVQPGVIYSHLTCVQSEPIREKYLAALREQLGEDVVNYLKLEDRIIAVGSPKIDKVLNTIPNKCIIPQEWEIILED